MKIAFIGGGAMGEAMLAAILNKKLSTPKAISVSDINESRRRYLVQQYGVTAATNLLAVKTGDVVILAVKPKDLMGLMAELRGQLHPSHLVLSVIAGARINTLSLGLNHDCLVRVMPNTPAQIGEGMSVWTATSEVSEQQRSRVKAILGAMGKEIYVDNEKSLDMVTAVSGSGPAYVFLFVETLVDAAVEIGLPRDMAEELVLQTLLGSGHLLQKSGKPPAELRRMVTSPGGTTAEALAKLDAGGFANLIKEAVKAAYRKAQQLGQ